MSIDFSKYPKIGYSIVDMDDPDEDGDSLPDEVPSQNEAGNPQAECSICLECTDEPRRLPCGHIFCLRCLEGLWQTVVSDNMTKCETSVSREFIKCPNCRRDVEIPEGGPLNLPPWNEEDENENSEEVENANIKNLNTIVSDFNQMTDIGRVEECQIHVELYHASSNLELPMLNSMLDPWSLYRGQSLHSSIHDSLHDFVHDSFQTNVTSSISSLDLEEKECSHDTDNHDNYRHLPWTVDDLDKCYDVVFLPGSRMAVSDQERNSVHLFGPHGNRLQCTLDFNIELQCPYRLAYHPQRDVIIVCEFQPKTLCILSRDVRHIRRRIKLDCRPLGIAVLHTNHLVVTARFAYGSDSGRVIIMSYQGVILASWHDGLGRPLGVAVDKDDVIYVSDHDNHRVIMYTAEGKRLRQFGNSSTMNSPRAVCSSPEGHILVAHDSKAENTDKISLWSTEGRALGHLLELHRDVTNQKINAIGVYKNRLAIVYEKKLLCKNLDRLPLLYDKKTKSLRRKKWIVVFVVSIVAVAILLVIILVTTNKLHI